MKKIALIILVVAMALTIAACGLATDSAEAGAAPQTETVETLPAE